MLKDAIPSQNLIVTPVSILSFDEQINLMIKWANTNLSKMVCVANVHCGWCEGSGLCLPR